MKMMFKAQKSFGIDSTGKSRVPAVQATIHINHSQHQIKQ